MEGKREGLLCVLGKRGLKTITSVLIAVFIVALIVVAILYFERDADDQKIIEGLSDEKLSQLAIDENDEMYCNNIQDALKKQSCLNLFTVVDNSQDNNLKQQAIREQNPTYCEQIQDELIKAGCLNLFQEDKPVETADDQVDYKQLAIEHQDVTYCYKINNTIQRTGCLNLFPEG